ncbi:MAG: ATPase, T2SS/T4P/T4SS family, partial [Thermodesulfobacteriota bacterium]
MTLEQDRVRVRRWWRPAPIELDYADIAGLETVRDNGRPGLLLELGAGRAFRLDLASPEEAERLRAGLEEIIRPGVLRETGPLPFERFANISRDLIESKGQNILKLARFLLAQALAHRAGDVTFEPGGDGLSVSYKIDGMIFPVAGFGPEVGRRLVNCLKAAAGLAVYREDVIQEGRLVQDTLDGPQDLRVSVFPTQRGQRVAVRTFDRLKASSRLEDLGFLAGDLAELDRIARAPQGLFIIGGPAGSGKTTTLYGLLRHLQNSRGRLAGIITLEDPVECRLPGITQVQVGRREGLDFAAVLRSCL